MFFINFVYYKQLFNFYGTNILPFTVTILFKRPSKLDNRRLLNVIFGSKFYRNMWTRRAYEKNIWVKTKKDVWDIHYGEQIHDYFCVFGAVHKETVASSWRGKGMYFIPPSPSWWKWGNLEWDIWYCKKHHLWWKVEKYTKEETNFFLPFYGYFVVFCFFN